ncbi:hypothetical protein [Streptococcus porci]|uniref:hypothetical protein n=1 Tax=Streptococcus porci TaxID=502567 RepID=UPI00041F9620|nr:hypothetical protein [Streptococcus porci]
MKKLFKTENMMTFFFLTLYGGGVWMNFRIGNFVLAAIWGLLFFINLGILIYRVYGKKGK